MGASTYGDPGSFGRPGHFWRIPARTEPPEGSGFYADGAEVGGSAPEGHVTRYPTTKMTFEDAQGRMLRFPWGDWGRIR